MFTFPERIHFMRIRHLAVAVSIILTVVGLWALFTRGLNLGLDFTGGTVIELHYNKPVNVEVVREELHKSGFQKYIVVHYGSEQDLLIRLQQDANKAVADKLLEVVRSQPDVEITLKRVEFVGPQVGDELRDQGGIGLMVAMLGILIYVSLRYQMKFSLGAIAAIVHDVIMTIGAFALFGWEFDMSVLAAVLSIVGYSVNDTIVVFDRIRENARKLRKVEMLEVIDISLTQTLSRTILTSFVTFLSVLALFLVGGESMRGFSIAFMIGIVVGTYSSIYIASNVAVMLKATREDLAIPVKEGEEIDGGRVASGRRRSQSDS